MDKKKAMRNGGLAAILGASAMAMNGCGTVPRDIARDNAYVVNQACEEYESSKDCQTAIDVLQKMAESKEFDEFNVGNSYYRMDNEEDRENYILNYIQSVGYSPEQIAGLVVRYGEDQASESIFSDYKSAGLRDAVSAGIYTYLFTATGGGSNNPTNPNQGGGGGSSKSIGGGGSNNGIGDGIR